MGYVEKVDRPKPWQAVYRAPDGRRHSKSFARKVEAERWLRVSEAETLTGQWVDPAAGEKLLGPYCGRSTSSSWSRSSRTVTRCRCSPAALLVSGGTSRR